MSNALKWNGCPLPSRAGRGSFRTTLDMDLETGLLYGAACCQIETLADGPLGAVLVESRVLDEDYKTSIRETISRLSRRVGRNFGSRPICVQAFEL